jgi:AraC-like DNA-binding protein
MTTATEPYTDLAPAGDPYFARHVVRGPITLPVSLRSAFVSRDYYGVFAFFPGSMEMGMEVMSSDGRIRLTELAPGRIYLWRPQDLRPFAGTKPGRIEFVEVGIRAAEWQAFTSLMGISPARLTAPEAPLASFDPFRDGVMAQFESLVRACRTGASVVDLITFLTAIVPRLFPQSATPYEGAPSWLWGSVEAMREEENLRLGMRRFRELARVSSRQLARVTHQYLGVTPGEVIANARIQLAMRLLRTSGDSVALISERCGYGTPEYFCKRFREATEMSPRAFRQRSLRGLYGARPAASA